MRPPEERNSSGSFGRIVFNTQEERKKPNRGGSRGPGSAGDKEPCGAISGYPEWNVLY
jgi:hypothetical protein